MTFSAACKAPNFVAQCLSGFETRFPGLKVRGYTRISVFHSLLELFLGYLVRGSFEYLGEDMSVHLFWLLDAVQGEDRRR